MSMSRTICFDISHLATRTLWPLSDGITNVDLAYGRHFLGRFPDAMVRYGIRGPGVSSPFYADRVVTLADRLMSPKGTAEPTMSYQSLRNAILSGAPLTARLPARLGRHFKSVAAGVSEYASIRLRDLAFRSPGTIPQNAVYLNVSQYRFESDRLFRWVEDRPDVRAVFLVHDLLPLDYPEFFLPIESRAFKRRIETLLRRSHGLIVTSDAVRERLLAEWKRRNLPPKPVLVAHLPSPLERASQGELLDAELAKAPYFVMVGTIEPRKNHLFLLGLWRQMAERAQSGSIGPAKLVLVGRNGWLNGQIRNELDRGRLIAPYVIQAPHLSQTDLARLLVNSRALLMPSFSEGYGLPLVEALSLSVPVIATDAPVFREVTQGRAIYHGPLDGPGWTTSIEQLAAPLSPLSAQAREEVSHFVAPTWAGYFEKVESFLQEQ